MQNLVLGCKIMFVTSLIMLLGTETDVIVNWDLLPLSNSQVIWSAVGYPKLTVPGQAFMRQFTNAIVHTLTGNILCRYLN